MFRKTVSVLLCLVCLTAFAAAEGLSGLGLLSDLDVILPADELLLADFGNEEGLMLKFTDIRLETAHPVSGESEEGYAYLRLDFGLANYSFDAISLDGQLSAFLMYDKTFRYDGELTLGQDTLGMLEETTGRLVFRLPGAVAADAERVALHVLVSGAEYLASIDVAEQAMAMGFTPAAADAGSALVLQNVKPMLSLSWNGEQNAAYRYLVLEGELFNNTSDTLETAAAVSATLTYQLLYQFDAQVETVREQIAPMETQTVRLVFRLPYMVAVSGDDETALLVQVNGQPQEIAFRMSDAVPSGHAYRVFYDVMNWEAAKAACEAMGGHLVTITSAEEDAFITTLYPNGDHLWYGGYADENRQWHWVTGEEFVYFNWAYGQPDNYRSNENYINSYQNQQWNDSDIEGENLNPRPGGYICEWDDARACAYEDAAVRNDDPAALSDAQVFAYGELTGGNDLAVKITEARAYQRLTEGANANYRELVIGLGVINTAASARTLRDTAQAALTFRDKYSFDPEITYSADELGTIETGSIRLRFNVPVMVINGKDEEVRLSLTVNGVPVETGFRISQHGEGIHAYSIFHSDRIHWDAAKEACAALGGYLVTIADAAENEFVKSLVATNELIWYGGYTDDSRQQWYWVTGEAFAFTEWRGGVPDNWAGKEFVLYRDNARLWNDGWRDSDDVSLYICEWDDVSLVPEDIVYTLFP